jgi:opacity protein-like surface antigen
MSASCPYSIPRSGGRSIASRLGSRAASLFPAFTAFTAFTAFAAVAVGLVAAHPTPAAAGESYLGHRIRPVYAKPKRPADHQNFVNLKFGGYDPEGPPKGGGFFGLTTGVEWQNRVALGFGLDVYRRTFSDETLIAEAVDANGNVITTTATRLETASTLVPLSVNLSLRLPGSRTLTPYVGGGIAYEILVNEINNYEIGVTDTNVYGGPGWQLFGGLLLPVTRSTRFLGELWFNDSVVRRDIDRYVQGLPVGERIDVGGLGARAGIEFNFD